ncbi:hypothetical protein [Allokutzneria albata]|uniref:Uncharacterized protein n=1 Tax=Allokutzneria albata TaxID=211114 RepID=A0A1H0DSP5_ALLAB|nr:hypothetical protein [Allokutzneria albata]SDN73182.1 hypothetical protein SAMN04489726_7974 [Allokutzneria albata]
MSRRLAGNSGAPAKTTTHVIRVIRPGLWGSATDRQLAVALLLVIAVPAGVWLWSLWVVQP